MRLLCPPDFSSVARINATAFRGTCLAHILQRVEEVSIVGICEVFEAVVEDAITGDTAAFVVNSPANPTGAVQSPADMRAFARIADEHDVLCIFDSVETIVRAVNVEALSP